MNMTNKQNDTDPKQVYEMTEVFSGGKIVITNEAARDAARLPTPSTWETKLLVVRAQKPNEPEPKI